MAAGKLERWRTERGISRAQMAKLLGYADRSGLRLYEAGRQRMSYERLFRAAQLTGMSVWDLAHATQRAEMLRLVKEVPEHLNRRRA